MAEPFSKSDKDWSRSIKVTSVKDSNIDPEDSGLLGSYSSDDRRIFVDLEKSKDPSETLAHEISHHELGHRGVNRLTDEDLHRKFSKFQEYYSGFKPGIEISPGTKNFLQVQQDYLDEFEVRIYQSNKGYKYVWPDTNFRAYLQVELMTNPDFTTKINLIRTALQAITNMWKKGVIDSKKAKQYRRSVYSFGKKAGVSKYL